MVFEPKKTKPVRKGVPTINIKISEEENNIVNKECDELKLTRSDFVRVCIGEYFKNKK